MNTDNWHLVYEALSEAQYLISNEIQCIMDDDVHNEYQSVLNKIDLAIQFMREHVVNQ